METIYADREDLISQYPGKTTFKTRDFFEKNHEKRIILILNFDLFNPFDFECLMEITNQLQNYSRTINQYTENNKFF